MKLIEFLVQTQWNGMNVLDGHFDDKNIQAGANTGQTIAIDLAICKLEVLEIYVIRGEAKITAAAAAAAAINLLQVVIQL